LLTAVTFFQNAPFFTNKILFFKNLILKIKYIKIKKKKKKKKEKEKKEGWPVCGWPNHPHGPRGASHPLWGGSATPLFFSFFSFHRLKGVARPPP
jgi:hypothetical protein